MTQCNYALRNPVRSLIIIQRQEYQFI